MKKRVLLLMVIGLSFAPPVLADEILGGRKIEDRKTGETTSQISSSGINCSYAHLDKGLEDGSKSAGGASSAGVAN